MDLEPDGEQALRARLLDGCARGRSDLEAALDALPGPFLARLGASGWGARSRLAQLGHMDSGFIDAVLQGIQGDSDDPPPELFVNLLTVAREAAAEDRSRLARLPQEAVSRLVAERARAQREDEHARAEDQLP